MSELLSELLSVFLFAASIGTALGYISGWIMAVRGAKSRYFQLMCHQAAASGGHGMNLPASLDSDSACLLD